MEMSNMKKFALYSLVFAIFILFTSQTSLFAQTGYELLAPLPGVEMDAEGKTTPSPYIRGIFALLIGIAGVLAVIMLIVGGIKYMSTDAFSGKSEAKNTIQNAIGGLLLALGAWIILYTINPGLVNFNLSLTPVPTTPSTAPAAGSSAGQPWPDDTSNRQYLTDTANIQINRNNCVTIGQTGCTSVSGLNTSVINGLINLIVACDAVPLYSTDGCTPRITGGTEYWLHGNRSTELTGPTANPTSHRPGGNAVDLGTEKATLNNYIRGGAVLNPRSSGCSSIGSAKYSRGGTIFALEGNHWHVCF